MSLHGLLLYRSRVASTDHSTDKSLMSLMGRTRTTWLPWAKGKEEGLELSNGDDDSVL